MKTIAVFASGNGTNLQAIIDNIAKGKLKARLACVVSDKKDAVALKRAKRAGIKSLYVDPKKFESKELYEKYIVECLREEGVEWIVLAGFMRILSFFIVRKYKNRILNIHPALLPAFKGAYAIKDAFAYGAKMTGVTVHLVDEKVDNGPIVAQETVEILDCDTIETLEARVHKVEHQIYSKAISKIISAKFKISGRRVIFQK